MSGLVILIPIAIAMGLAALVAFLWALRSGQYEDTCTPSMRLLTDDRQPRQPKGDPSVFIQEPK